MNVPYAPENGHVLRRAAWAAMREETIFATNVCIADFTKHDAQDTFSILHELGWDVDHMHVLPGGKFVFAIFKFVAEAEEAKLNELAGMYKALRDYHLKRIDANDQPEAHSFEQSLLAGGVAEALGKWSVNLDAGRKETNRALNNFYADGE